MCMYINICIKNIITFTTNDIKFFIVLIILSDTLRFQIPIKIDINYIFVSDISGQLHTHYFLMPE